MLLIDSLTIKGINFYQKNISPKKGYRCAYCFLHGQESCSQYAKNSILKEGLITAISLTLTRLRECRKAYEILQQHQDNDTGENSQGSDKTSDSGETNPCKKQGDTCANLCTMPCL